MTGTLEDNMKGLLNQFKVNFPANALFSR